MLFLGKELAELQQKEEDLSCLPTLLISDIERDTARTSVQHVDLGQPVIPCCVTIIGHQMLPSIYVSKYHRWASLHVNISQQKQSLLAKVYRGVRVA